MKINYTLCNFHANGILIYTNNKIFNVPKEYLKIKFKFINKIVTDTSYVVAIILFKNLLIVMKNMYTAEFPKTGSY